MHALLDHDPCIETVMFKTIAIYLAFAQFGPAASKELENDFRIGINWYI